jgi:hypothetical protein
MKRILSVWSASLVIGNLSAMYNTLPEYKSNVGATTLLTMRIEPVENPLIA